MLARLELPELGASSEWAASLSSALLLPQRDQTKEKMRLTIKALREREEHEIINDPEFGLLHNVDHKYFLAQPQVIAAFGRELSRRGINLEQWSLILP